MHCTIGIHLYAATLPLGPAEERWAAAINTTQSSFHEPGSMAALVLCSWLYPQVTLLSLVLDSQSRYELLFDFQDCDPQPQALLHE